MRKTTSFCVALMLSITTAAWASDTESSPNTTPEAAIPAPAADVPAVPAVDGPAASAPVAAPAAKPVPVEAKVEPACGPEPYIGWGRGVRAPMYANLMIGVGGYVEDGDNRLTTRDSKLLEGFGGIFRVGAVLDEHSRIGARMQWFARPTKKVLADPPVATTTDQPWGAVTFGYVGPEYLYFTDFGLYGAASVGVGAAMSTRHIDHESSDKDDDIERGSAGAAGMLSVGYEWRTSKWFALNAEAFAGLYHGIDDDDNSMNGALFGVAMGAGF
jgi:hypothetical protein